MRTSRKLLRLGSVTMFLALVAMLILPTTALAESGIFGGGYTVNVAGSGVDDYTADEFNNANLGTIGCGQTLLFVGGYVDTFKNGSSNVTGASINYRVYPQGNPAGNYANLDAPHLCDRPNDQCSGFGTDGDQRWRKSDGTTDVAAGLGPGTYTIEAYSQAESTDGTYYLSNNGDNYKATFTVLARTTSGSGNWNANSTWVGGSVPATDANVDICNGSTVTLDTNPTVRSIKINTGATLQDDATASTLTLEGSSTASPTFSNAGTFTAGTGTVHFKGQSVNGNTRNGKVWGPTATTFNNVIITYNGIGTGSDNTFGVDFYDQTATAMRATINGVLTLNTRTFVANLEPGRDNATSCNDRDCGTPTYGSGSTLRYNDLEYAETHPGTCPGAPVTNPFQTYSEWLNATSGHGVPHNVTVGSDSWVSLRCNAGTSYRVNGDFTVEAGVDGNTYGGTGTTPDGFEQNGFDLGVIGSSTLTLAAGKDVVNNGTLKQSGTPGAGTTSFVNIKDTSSANLYYGVDIVGGSVLGSTTVKVSGNQDTCPFVHAGSRPVKRCYYFDVAAASSPQVVFYYEYGELRSGQDPATLNVWKDNGNGTWTMITPSARSTCTSGMINCSVTVSSLTGMAAGANRYVLMSSNPQSVTLAEFSAQQVADYVQVSWETVSEIDNRGFNLYRGVSPAGWDRQLNELLIPSQGQGSPSGFVYTWDDHADLVPGTSYYYWLEDLDISGAATLHGPVSVDFVAPTAVTLSSVAASPAAGAGALPWLLVVAAAGAALGVSRMRR
jgi:hypothetical protein